jgi:hypothetical protein
MDTSTHIVSPFSLVFSLPVFNYFWRAGRLILLFLRLSTASLAIAQYFFLTNLYFCCAWLPARYLLLVPCIHLGAIIVIVWMFIRVPLFVS